MTDQVSEEKYIVSEKVLQPAWIGFFFLFAVARRNKIIGHNYGLLYRDVAFLPKEVYTGKPINGEFRDSPTICIEIKVKQGYMNCDKSNFNLNSIQKCRFCYFQVCQALCYQQINSFTLFFAVFKAQKCQNKQRIKILPH